MADSKPDFADARPLKAIRSAPHHTSPWSCSRPEHPTRSHEIAVDASRHMAVFVHHPDELMLAVPSKEPAAVRRPASGGLAIENCQRSGALPARHFRPESSRRTGRQSSGTRAVTCPNACRDLDGQPHHPAPLRRYLARIRRPYSPGGTTAAFSGGCWCTWFHTLTTTRTTTKVACDLKSATLVEGGVHTPSVFDGDKAVAWAEYGPPEELPNIHHRQGTRRDWSGRPLPGHHLHVDRRYRRRRVAALAHEEPSTSSPKASGEAGRGYPHDMSGNSRRGKMSSSFSTTAPARCTRRPASPSRRSEGRERTA